MSPLDLRLGREAGFEKNVDDVFVVLSHGRSLFGSREGSKLSGWAVKNVSPASIGINGAVPLMSKPIAGKIPASSAKNKTPRLRAGAFANDFLTGSEDA
jgi:hypothetical protein